MDALRKAVNAHPLFWFVGIAYALSWWSVPFANGALIPHGPTLAALLIIALTKGRPGLVELWRRMSSCQGGFVWLLVGPGLVILYLAFAFALNVLLGAEIANTSHITSLGATFVTLLLLGGWWEEPGWTGHALPLLQERCAERPMGPFQASVIMGLIRSVWHLPLAAYGHIPWYDVVFFSMAFQFLISWLYNRSGSVLPPMLFHLTSNVVGGALLVPLFVDFDHERYYVLFIAFAWVLAVALNIPRNWYMGRRDVPA